MIGVYFDGLYRIDHTWWKDEVELLMDSVRVELFYIDRVQVLGRLIQRKLPGQGKMTYCDPVNPVAIIIVTVGIVDSSEL